MISRPPVPVSHTDLAEALLGAFAKAAALQLAGRGGALAAERKADTSLVTSADRDSEALLVEALQAVAPELAVIAEEAVSDGRCPETGASFFLVDPLDGTRDFVAGGDDFTINVALVVDGAARFGMVLAPAVERLFVTISDSEAVEGRLPPGAALPGRLEDLSLRRIEARQVPPRGPTALVSRTSGGPEQAAFLAARGTAEVFRLSSSLKFCLIAAGEADLYPSFRAISEWDVAAGHAILAAAGGTVVDLEGRMLTYGHRERRFRVPPFVAAGRSA